VIPEIDGDQREPRVAVEDHPQAVVEGVSLKAEIEIEGPGLVGGSAHCGVGSGDAALRALSIRKAVY